jgi:hypothetical protein
LIGITPFWLDPMMQPQDPMNVPSGVATHGAEGKDVVGDDFAEARLSRCGAPDERKEKPKNG